MINYKNPSVELLPDPVGIDLTIQQIQLYLANLPWLEKSFGRAIVQRELPSDAERKTRLSTASQQGRREIIYPEVYQAKQEPLNVMCNDALKSYSFFLVEDPQRFEDWMPLQQLQAVSYPVNIIFWMNLQKINPVKDYRYGEELKNNALLLLSRMPSLIIDRVYEQYEEIFRGFTLTETYRQYLKPPYYGFRISGSVLGDIRTCAPIGVPVIQAPPEDVIQFIVGQGGAPLDGAATFTDDRLKNKKAFVYRNKIFEWYGNPGNGDTYYEKPLSGPGSETITFFPPLTGGELVQILI